MDFIVEITSLAGGLFLAIAMIWSIVVAWHISRFWGLLTTILAPIALVPFSIKYRAQLKNPFRLYLVAIIFASFIVFELYITVWPVVSSYISEGEITLVRSQILFRLLCFSLPIIFVLAAFIIIFSNRIAGPIYRLERTLDELLKGENVEPIYLREKDEFKELVSKINDIILLVKKLQKG